MNDSGGNENEQITDKLGGDRFPSETSRYFVPCDLFFRFFVIHGSGMPKYSF